jgi:hypothetical protein
VSIRPFAVLAAFGLSSVLYAPAAAAEPESEVVHDVSQCAPVDAAVVDARVESTPPATLRTPDDWELTLSASDEAQSIAAPLTTALSSREYVVGGTFSGEMSGPDIGEAPRGVLEAGYEIGCGIDMSTSNGVSLTATAGIGPSISVIGTDMLSPLPDGIIPGVGGNLGGGVTVGLKPGIINVVPVARKEFKGTEPWVMVSNFRVKIDGCVGESFIRSYALLTRSTDQSDAVLAWYGTTKVV